MMVRPGHWVPAALLALAAVGCAVAPPRGSSLRPASVAETVAPAEPPAVLTVPAEVPAAEPVVAAELPSVPEPDGRPAPAEPPPAADAAFPLPDRPEVRAVLAEFTGPLRRSFGLALRRGDRYLSMIRGVLQTEGLPPELAYLALVESSFAADARSPAGAVGMWQFIEGTARQSGLRVDWWADERLDPELATWGAARHLKELYGKFGNWDLALAAYNAGAGGVGRALAAEGLGCYWELSAKGGLRPETDRYVPKFWAAVAIARDPVAYGFDLERAELPVEAPEIVWVEAPVDLSAVARVGGVAPAVLADLNPSLLRGSTPPGRGRYSLRVPAGTGERIVAGLGALPTAERWSFRRHEVRQGDTLKGLARQYGTTAAAVAQLNGLGVNGKLRLGDALVLPAGGGGKRAASGGSARDYVVKAGDTASAVAARHGQKTADLLKRNGLTPSSVIRPGDRLVIDAGSGAEARVHVVREGDTLWALARQYGTTVEDLARKSGVTPGGVLRLGDRIVVGIRDEDG